MPVAIAAGAAVLGSVLGGIGASKRADAIKKALGRNKKDVISFTGDQIGKSEKLGEEKQTYLEKGDPFTEMGRFIFGDPSKDTFANLRKSQSDFAQLAAGKTDNFSKEVSSIVQGALANTFGGPRGSFENLSAKNMLSFRQSGLQSALGLTDFFNRTGSQLTNAKFGILDQSFERQLSLRQNQLNQVNAIRLGKSEQSGVGWMAAGNVMNAVSSAASGYAQFGQNAAALTEQKAFNTGQLDIMKNRQGQSQPYNYSQPSSYAPSTVNYGGALPNFYGGGGQFGGAMPNFYETFGGYNYGRQSAMAPPTSGYYGSPAAAYNSLGVLPLPPVGG